MNQSESSQPESPQGESAQSTQERMSLEKLRRELDRLLESAMTQGERALGAFGFRGAENVGFPPVDVVETPDDVVVTVDLPGSDPNAILITLAGNMLTLKGEKPAIGLGEDHTVHAMERTRGLFSRSIPMPVPVNPDDVTANSKEGVLTIRLPKLERAKPRQIQIHSTESSESQGSSPPINPS